MTYEADTIRRAFSAPSYRPLAASEKEFLVSLFTSLKALVRKIETASGDDNQIKEEIIETCEWDNAIRALNLKFTVGVETHRLIEPDKFTGAQL